MGDLSDLDLVAKAMAPTNEPDKTTPKPPPKTQNGTSNKDDNLDISSLTPEDYALLEPLLRALELSDSDVLDEAAMADVLRQMDVAGDVADDLEGKLDRLIGQLGEVEEGILADAGEKEGKVAGTKANDTEGNSDPKTEGKTET